MAGDPTLERVTTSLDALGIEYEVIDCDPDLADTAAFCAHYGYPVEQAANAIIVASKKEPVQYVACLVLAHTRLDVNKTVRKRMGVSKASFASPEATAELTGMQIGGVTPFALPDSLPIYVDSRIMDCDWVVAGAGSRSAKLKVAPSAFAAMPAVEVVEGLANEQ